MNTIQFKIGLPTVLIDQLQSIQGAQWKPIFNVAGAFGVAIGIHYYFKKDQNIQSSLKQAISTFGWYSLFSLAMSVYTTSQVCWK